MSRPLRLEIPDGWYHVMNRGLRRHATFTDDEDHTLFLDTLGQACLKFGVGVGAFCLMPNHYHLLVHTPDANLSRFMRHVNGVYTQRFNRKNGKDGPLFRGRYRALIVDADSYLLQVIRYIHLNPVKAKLCAKPESFRWSSHRAYIKDKGAPDWLTSREVLKLFSSRMKSGLELYKQFMKEPQDPQLESFYQRKQLGWLLGDEVFLEKMKRKMSIFESDTGEIPQSRKALGEHRLEMIANMVARYYKIPKQRLSESQPGKTNLPRSIAMYLCWELSGLSQGSIAEFFGANSYRTVAAQHFKVKNKAKRDKGLLRLLKSFKTTYGQLKT